MKIYQRHELQQFQNMDYLIQKIQDGFVAYSQGKVVMPPVCHMHLDQPSGDLHVKCASMPDEKSYVVKIASCFPENSKMGLPAIKGIVLLFNRNSGEPETLFLDEGYLTHLRTAIAGAIFAKYFAPQSFEFIGIIGAGMQARSQLQFLSYVTSCRQVWIWAPNKNEIKQIQQDKIFRDFEINIASSPKEVAHYSRLIVTTTPSLKPLLFSQDIAKGTHVTAIGSDRPGKQELDSGILKMADRIIVDSKEQCFQYGETFCAIQDKAISKDRVDEIGEVIAGNKQPRINEDEITIADLTGLGVQDLVIALTIRKGLEEACLLGKTPQHLLS